MKHLHKIMDRKHKSSYLDTDREITEDIQKKGWERQNREVRNCFNYDRKGEKRGTGMAVKRIN
jgi:hypothetical protein